MHSSPLRYFLGLLMVLSNSSFSQQIKHPVIQHFSIKPLICITNEVNQPCKMTVTLNWQASEPINACLFQGKQSIHCWQQQRNINQKIEIQLMQDNNFTLINDEHVYAQQDVTINSVIPRTYRRRLRAEWSLF